MSHFASYSKKKIHTLILEHWSKVLPTHGSVKKDDQFKALKPDVPKMLQKLAYFPYIEIVLKDSKLATLQVVY